MICTLFIHDPLVFKGSQDLRSYNEDFSLLPSTLVFIHDNNAFEGT
jgi:hypothetical protein